MIPNHYRCACCGSTNIVTVTYYADYSTTLPWPSDEFTKPFSELERTFYRKVDDPEWGWWTAYYPPHPVNWFTPAHRPIQLRRPQSRCCRIDRARWKRRRFVQRLRVQSKDPA